MSFSQDTSTPSEEPQVLRATRARQGSWGRHILWVLVISTALAALALLGSWALSIQTLRGQGGQTMVQETRGTPALEQSVPETQDQVPSSPNP